MTIRNKDNEAQNLISAAQTITGAWAALGELIDTRDIKKILLWTSVDINDSQDVRFRFVGKQTLTDSNDWLFPIKTATASAVGVQAEYFELSVDADTKIILDTNVSDVVPYIQIQVMAGTAGASPGQILTAQVTFESNAISKR